MKKCCICFLIISLAGCITPEKTGKTGTAETAGSTRTTEKAEVIEKSRKLIPGKGFWNFILNSTHLDYFESHKKEISAYTEMGFWFEFNRKNILSLIGTMSPEVSTSQGVTVGDTEEKIIRIYGEPVKKDFEKKIYPEEFFGFDSLFDYTLVYKGILFYINEQRVEAIALFSEDFPGV
jgi:hypothetical protein